VIIGRKIPVGTGARNLQVEEEDAADGETLDGITADVDLQS
jgi:hypothetical protein